MKLFSYKKNNRELEASICFQITSWMGTLALPLGIRWWSTKDVKEFYNFMLDVDILCFTLCFEYWNFGDKE